ncbi:MAG TPA: hypothetical protein VFD58_09915 [Blastocatellia bacterium]|nr:hypothetical protein [Blastocatellia bacterium]
MPAKAKEAGFTLAEFLVGTTVMLIMIAMGLGLLDKGQTLFRSQSAATAAQARARKGLNFMVADLRSTGAAPVAITGGATPGILSATATGIHVAADRNGNGTTNVVDTDVDEDITYTFDSSAGTITRLASNDSRYQSGGAAQPAVLIDNVDSLAIRYFDNTGTELTALPLSAADRDRVTRLQIVIVTNVRENGQTTGTVTVDSTLTLRNRQLDNF